MTDLLTLAKDRFAARKYLERPVEAEKLARILEAGRLAPTGANAQPQRVLVVQSAEGRAKLSQAANIYGAPLALVVCCETAKAWVRPYDHKSIADIDAAIVTDHMMLAAAEAGLASVWICYFKPDVIKEAFNLPPGVEPVNILALGYSEEKAPAKMRKEAGETIFYETF